VTEKEDKERKKIITDIDLDIETDKDRNIETDR
jgi:hypothetical protein